MQSRIIAASAFTLALGIVACSGTPDTMLSPSGVAPSTSALNPDGSNLKVDAPTDLSPTDGDEIDTVRPTLRFSEAAGRHVSMDFEHEIEILDASGSRVYEWFPVSGNSHTVQDDLDYDDPYRWRVRARLGNDIGPWSEFAEFRTPDLPDGGGGELPFPVPSQCGPGGPTNRIGCVIAVAGLSGEWQSCRRGNGVACHRFARQVAASLSRHDPNWKMIRAAPGGHACNCSRCGPSDGTMFREETVVYGGNRVFDMITGAGGPNPGLAWSRVPGPRSGDIPTAAPVCAP